MNFEQPASLNRYILPPIQFTWAFRWTLFKLFLPVTVFCALFITQAILLKAWVRDDWGHWLFLRILIAIGIVPVAFVFSVEWVSRLERKRGKTIQLEENYIRTGPGLAQRASWPKIVAWQFNNIAAENNYRLATVEYKLAFKDKKLGRCCIVLEKSQMDQLISEVKSRRQKNGLNFLISDQKSDFVPKSFELKKGDAPANYLFFAGAFLCIEGLPLLLAGLGTKEDSRNSDFTPNLNGSFAKFIRAHFSSVAELHHFCLITGAFLCGSGLVLIIWSRLLNKRQKSQPA